MKTRPFTSFVILLIALNLLLLADLVKAQDCKLVYSTNDLPYCFSLISAKTHSVNHIDKWLTNDLSQIAGPFQKDKKDVYMERHSYLKRLLEDDYFLFYDSLQQVVDQLASRLLEKNKIANADRLQILISRSGVPNASCRGEGTIVINAGLLERLDNTDQLAFILAHELAHHHFDHVNQSIDQRINFLNSEETNKKISAAREGKEMANSDLRDWLKENAFDYSRHKRNHELETDSLGIVFYLQAGFPANGALSALQLLEFIDDAPLPMTSLKKHFDFKDYPWKEAWAISHLSGLSLVKITDEEKILLRTHPELEERIAQAKNMLPGEESNINIDLCKWKKSLSLEILERYYETWNLLSALVQAIEVLDKNPENIYSNAIVAHSLLDLCQARKEHRFSDFIPPPNSKMREDYFQMATFLDNLSFTNLKKITQQWVEQNCENLTDEEIKRALEIKMTQMENDFIPADSMIAQFKNKWPNSIFLD